MSDLLKNPGRLRRRAEVSRMIAGAMRDPETRLKMLNIAERYERLAQRAEDRLWVIKFISQPRTLSRPQPLQPSRGSRAGIY
jgi:hypothetical protein